MSTHVRDVVVRALDMAAGLLDRPEYAREVLAGRDLRLDVLDLDSLTIFEIVMEIEDSLGIELDAEVVAGKPTVNALVGYLEQHTQAKGPAVRV